MIKALYFLILATVAIALDTVSVRIENTSLELTIHEKRGIGYFTTDELCSKMIVRNRILTSQKRKESLRIFARSFVFTPFSPFVVVDGEAYSLGAATFIDDKFHYIPFYGFLRVLYTVTGKDIVVEYADGNEFNFSSTKVSTDTEATQAPPPLPWNDQVFAEKLEVSREWIVVIDPGHGGKDPGAIGPSGLFEKDVVLDISKRIKLLSDEYPNMKVVLTRGEDIFLPLQMRGEIAKEARGDIFISVHCNASPNSESNGAETFFLSPAKTTEARATALLENMSLKYEDETDYDPKTIAEYILADFVQNEFIRESSRLSSKIATKISESGNLRSRGASQAAFYVLKDNIMPSVLVEVAFISNEDEEKKLKSTVFKDKIAKAILDGVDDFIKEFAH